MMLNASVYVNKIGKQKPSIDWRPIKTPSTPCPLFILCITLTADYLPAGSLLHGTASSKNSGASSAAAPSPAPGPLSRTYQGLTCIEYLLCVGTILNTLFTLSHLIFIKIL